MESSMELNEQPKCIFSTELGRKAPRPALDPPNRPLPACVIVRSHPLQGVEHFAEVLKARYPLQCHDIYAGFMRNDFFDPYDVHLYGADFLDAVLSFIAEPNNRRVVEFATGVATAEPDKMLYLSSVPILTNVELTRMVCKLFDVSTIDTYGPRMLCHVIHHLKYTMSQMHKEEDFNQEQRMNDKNATPTQSPEEKRSTTAMYNTTKNPRMDAPSGTNTVNGMAPETSMMSRTFQPPAALPKPTPKRFLDETPRGNYSQDMRRTASAEQTMDQNSYTARQKMDRNAGRGSYRLPNGPGQYPPPQGPMSVPPTPVMHSSTSVQPRVSSIGARQTPFVYGYPPGMPTQIPQAQYYDSFNPYGQAFEPARYQGQGGQITPHMEPASIASNYSHIANASRASSFYPGSVDGPGAPPNFYPTAPTPFQGQLPLPPPLVNTGPSLNYGNRANPSFPKGQYPHHKPMWEQNQQAAAGAYMPYQAVPQEKSGRFNHSDIRGHHSGRGLSRGQNSNGHPGRGGSYQKTNGSRRFSVGSTNNRNRKGAQGSLHADIQSESKPVVQASDGNLQTGPVAANNQSDVQKVQEPFPDFGSPLEKRGGHGITEMPEDREHGCSQHYIGSKRTDVKDVWVQGFPVSLGTEGAERALDGLFQTVAPVAAVSVTIRQESGAMAFAFVTFNSTEHARRALALNGSIQFGNTLRVQVPEKYHPGSKDRRQSKSTNWTNGQMAGYRRPSGQNYHGQRSSLEGRGSFTGTQPVYMSQEYAQSLGHGSPQTPFHPNSRRTSGYQPSYAPSPARRALPNGANAEFIQRLKSSSRNYASETTGKDSAVSYSPQDCRSTIPDLQADRNFEPNSSPERKKKSKKNRASPEKAEVVQEIAASEASSQTTKDSPPQTESQNAVQSGEAIANATSDSAHEDKKHLKAILGMLDVFKKKRNDQVDVKDNPATSEQSPADVSGNSVGPSMSEAFPESPKTPQSPMNSSAGVQEPYSTPPEAKQKTDESFYSALEAHTPNNIQAEATDSVDSPVTVIASSEIPVPEVEVSEDHSADDATIEGVLKASDIKEEADAKDSVAAKQVPVDVPEPETGLVDAVVEAKPDLRAASVDPPLEEKRRQATTPEPLPAAARKAKSPKATPPPNQGALHPFAKANQVKKSSQSKKQKKKDKAKAKKQTKDGDRTPLGDISVNSVTQASEPSFDIVSSTSSADQARIDSPVEPPAPLIVSLPVNDAPQPQARSMVKAPTVPVAEKKLADETPAVKKEERIEKKEDKPQSPEKKPKEKSSLASKAAKLVALPDLGRLRRGVNAAKGNTR